MIVLSLEGIKTSKKEKRKSSCQLSQKTETQVYRESQDTASLSPGENQNILPQKPGGVKGLQAATVSWLTSLQTLRKGGY